MFVVHKLGNVFNDVGTANKIVLVT